MLIRVRSKDGTFRFELDPNADARELGERILSTTTDADPMSLAISNQPRGGETKITQLLGRSLTDLGLRHGDLLFASYTALAAPITNGTPNGTANGVSYAAGPSTSNNAAQAVAAPSKRPWEAVQEDAVDGYWREKDGKIPRGRDPNFCKHGANAMCDYCMPIEPFDASYHASHSIKHLSYHAYLRKLTSSMSASATSSTTALPPLENLSYRVKVPCTSGSHAPWPAGICSKCQPSAITLQPQPFRMVDHVEFASAGQIDAFLGAWRRTGLQRFGFLIGRYAPYPEVPMGIKAVVEAIHEPPQEGEVDGFTLGMPWDDESRINALAVACKGLQIIGVIYTDLTPQTDDKTKSICKRHAASYFLSSLETLFAARLQMLHPNPSRSAASGTFSSRFVTCVLSGTPEGGIDVASYQASEQACAMLDADMIEPSLEPGTVRVKEEQGDRYVPDVFFRFKNEYGIEVKQSAKPCFPVEYLLVNVTHGFPTNQTPLFLSTKFPIENRPGLDRQDLSNVVTDLTRLNATALSTKQKAREDVVKRRDLLKYLSDWHLLAFLSTENLFSPRDIQILARTITGPDLDSPDALDELFEVEGWLTLLAHVQATSSPEPPAARMSENDAFNIPDDVDIPPDGPVGASHSAGTKFCPHCTFENSADASDCAICGLPMD